MIRSNLNVVLRILVCFSSHLRHFFFKLYFAANKHQYQLYIIFERSPKRNWKRYEFPKQHILTIVCASMYVLSYLRYFFFFNWSTQQINSDNNCIFLLSSCQNQSEIDRRITASCIHFIQVMCMDTESHSTFSSFFFPITFVIFRHILVRALILSLHLFVHGFFVILFVVSFQSETCVQCSNLNR